MGLVDYADSDSGEDVSPKSRSMCSRDAPPAKRRKVLPPVPTDYLVDPKDDPALHQGRSRSRPFVPGELNAHIYLSLKAPKSLRTAITDLIASAQAQLPHHTLYSLLETPTPSQKAGELHISITHPLPLRRSQVDPLRVELAAALKAWARTRQVENIKCSLAGVPTIYYNGKATGGDGKGGRAFLALRVGAGAVELDSIIEKVVHPILNRCHLPLYHTNPEYHASFAWCLLDPTTTVNPQDQEESEETAISSETTPPFSEELVRELGVEHGARILAKQPSGGWDVDCLVLRAGKAIHEIPLS